MTMDLKEIIKWFIPCFHILLLFKKMDTRLTLIFLFLFFNCYASGAMVNSDKELDVKSINAKNLIVYDRDSKFNSSEIIDGNHMDGDNKAEDFSVGRTFGRPFMKKMIGSMLPLIFQIGAASTWAVVAAIVGVKTLMVTLVILKLLLVAGAAKFGALFSSHKSHHSHGWEPHHPSKEIHLHIHNGHIGNDHEEHFTPWSRETGLGLETKNYNVIMDTHSHSNGPQTISTPFGNYVKVDPH